MTKEELAKQQILIKLPVKEEEALPAKEVARILNVGINLSQLTTILTKLANRKKVRYNGEHLYVFWRNAEKERNYKNVKFSTYNIKSMWEQKLLSVLPGKEEEAITPSEATTRIYDSYGAKRAITTIRDYLSLLCSYDVAKRKKDDTGSGRSYVYWLADEDKSEKEAEEGENINPNERSKLNDSTRAFIDECVWLKPSEKYPQATLWNDYEYYCDMLNLQIQQRSVFTSRIRELRNVTCRHAKVGGKSQRTWHGLTFKGHKESENLEHTDGMETINNWLKRVNELHKVNEELREALVRRNTEIEQLKKELVGKSNEITKLKEERMDYFSIQAEERVKSDIAESRKLLEGTFKG